MAPKTHPPAWYPDPRHPGQLRRWDGRSWTQDVRPIPGWLRSLRLAPGPGTHDRNRAVRRLWALSTITMTCALVLLLALVNTSPPEVPAAERVGDDEFLAAADRECARAKRDVVEPYLERRDGDAEELADGMSDLVTRLRDLPIARADAARADAWFAAWDEWIAAGHRYADALDDGERDAAAAISADSQTSKLRINRFALANGLTSCVL